MGPRVESVLAREVLDSRGNPTLEVEVSVEGGYTGRAMVPSGASTGRFEALELRDGGSRFHGRGVVKAVRMVREEVAPRILGMDAEDQAGVDRALIELDGTADKSRLGGNTTLGVSLAVAKAAAASKGVWLYQHLNREAALLPVPFFNVINGGKHAGNDLDVQEFMVAPVGVGTLKEAVQAGSEIYHQLKERLREKYGRQAINVGDEGGFSPPLSTTEEALEELLWAVEEAGYGGEAVLALDAAATSFYQGGAYLYQGQSLTAGEMIEVYEELVEKYPIKSLEDPLEEEDFQGFSELTRALDIQVVGDDLFVTNTKRLAKGIEAGACNALLWKVNQVGTLTEALEAWELARSHGYAVMASHRSGDTEDPFLADLAVAIECGQIKSGAPCRGERTSKYNQLLRIEERLGSRARYPQGILNP